MSRERRRAMSDRLFPLLRRRCWLETFARVEGCSSPRRHGALHMRAAWGAMSVLLVSAACAGTGAVSNAGASFGGTSASGGMPAVDGGNGLARVAACRHYFNATEACAGRTPSDAELARLANRFDEGCLARFDMTGAAYSAADLEACATALDSAGCGSLDGLPPACDLRGSLPGGAPCMLALQCQSGICSGGQTIEQTADHPISIVATCGTCASAAAKDAVCSGGGCANGLTCVSENIVTIGASECEPLSLGGAGAACDPYVPARCQPGLYCTNETCTPLGKVGTPCQDPGGYGCAPSLVCTGVPGNCAPLGAVGYTCSGPEGGRPHHVPEHAARRGPVSKPALAVRDADPRSSGVARQQRSSALRTKIDTLRHR